MKAFVTIASFENMQSAERLHTWLKEAQITSEVIDPGETEKIAFFLDRKVLYKVRVQESQAEAARRILGMGANRLPGLILCPECRSSRVEFPQVTRKFMGLLTIFGILYKIGLFRPKFFCQDCQLTWAPKEESRFGHPRPRPA